MYLQVFYDLFEDLMIEEHKQEFQYYQNLLKNYEEQKYSIHGVHYASCPWALDATQSGPDTCQCSYRRQMKRKLTNIIKLYFRIFLK